MSQLFSTLGIDWHLLLSQAVNFFLLLLALWYFVYGPLLKLLRDRRDKIALGVTKAEEADLRLHEVDLIGKGKIKEAELAAMAILKKTESDAKDLEMRLIAEARRKEADEMRNAEAVLRAKEEESRRAMEKEAAAFVRSAIVKTVELSPEQIDDALIAKAVKEAAMR
jgi:F-type H+-transporting ATPase subunit b